ncbi:MAG: DNA polymerase III subunit alpha [Candidatus Chaera renei]|uniref:DNA polymerase III subunit alpha n=1 Tax=Candidatus Chaera renei TaxID=2506947 RepID=A0A4Q0AJ03_9BACT|nr:MAG: DNA polymerase III subunit alpha [Candidatus Chaera renei]
MKGSTDTARASASKTRLVASDYVHLHNHTHHSLLDGLTKVEELVERVKQLGMQAVAITDHGTLSGAIEFYKCAKAAGIKPIIGMEAYVASRTIHDRDPSLDRARYHLTLLAMNQTGYQNLMRLSTIANLKGMYYKPRIDRHLLEKYNEGLIVLSGCAGGELGENLRAGNYKQAKAVAEWYRRVFGDRYYLEIQDHNEWQEQRAINRDLFKLGRELDIPCALTSDAHYLMPEDREAHEILLCVGTSAYLEDTDRMSLKEFELHVTDPKDIIGRWGKDYPEIVKVTKQIADRCQLELELGKIMIPGFPVPGATAEKDYLERLVYRGLVERYAELPPDLERLSVARCRRLLPQNILERAKYELSTVDSMGFNGYFLIIWDFIKWGKERGIVFGPGRGSAAGSIISYALKITDLDPLKYDLLFERFLNPDRISMPDIDIDIMDTRRDEVINYCVQKYGEDRVANIVTFGRMAARAAVRDVARVLKVPYGEADRIAKLIPPPVQGRHTPLGVSLKNNPDLKKEYASNPMARQVFDYAVRLEGTIRSHGVHAAGVVIAPDDIVRFTPLEMAQKGVVATQYAMGPIDDLGLLKMDFLGLSNLTIIKNALRIIKRVYKTEIDLDKLPLDDAATFKLFQKGDTTGVFQLESAGMKRYLKELKPTVFDDIIAMVALYRPGPIQFIDDFIDRKHGRKRIAYLHPKMENALKSTYGVLVYQEQVMQISKDLCGFSGGQADTLRKGIGKKIPEVLAKMKPAFIDGAVKHGGADRRAMEEFWQKIEAFGAYCFNKSHAACYAMIAYWTAYLKAHYPAAFMAALMTSDRDNIDRLAIEISECRHMGITVLPPDVNQGFVEFGVTPGANSIRFGLAAIKGVGEGAVEEILRLRDEDGPFQSVEDFARRCSTGRFLNKKVWESLIKAGALDGLADRSDLLYNIDAVLAFAQKQQKELKSNQADLFGGLAPGAAPGQTLALNPAPVRHQAIEKLQWERELLGLYLSAHPLDSYQAYLQKHAVPISSLTAKHEGKTVTVGGIISSIRTILTKNGSKMAFVKFEDKSGEAETVVFPSLFERLSDSLKQDLLVKISGRVSWRGQNGKIGDELKIAADQIDIITDAAEDTTSSGDGLVGQAGQNRTAAVLPGPGAKAADQPSAPTLYIHVKKPFDHQGLLKLKQTLGRYPGINPIVLVLGDPKQAAVKLPFGASYNPDLKEALSDLYGSECLALR